MKKQLFRRMLHEGKARSNRRRILLMEDLRAGYIPIPKVASSSLRLLICQRQARHLHPELLEQSPRALQKEVERRIRISRGPAGTRRLGERYFLFAFVRNPLTRLYSCYRDKVVKAAEQGKEFSLAPWGVEPGMSFDWFVRHIARIPDSRSEQHFRSQHLLLRQGGHWMVDYLGRFENLDDDWQELSARIGLDARPKAKRSSGAGASLDGLPLGREAAELAVERYWQDIALLGYRDEISAWLDRL